MCFWPGVEAVFIGEAVQRRSSLGPGLATELRHQLLRNGMDELLVFKREP